MRTCLDENATCFDTYRCNYEDFRCRSNVTDRIGKFDDLLDQHNELVNDCNAPLEKARRAV